MMAGLWSLVRATSSCHEPLLIRIRNVFIADARYATHTPDCCKDEEVESYIAEVPRYAQLTGDHRSEQDLWVVLIIARGGLGHTAEQYAKVISIQVSQRTAVRRRKSYKLRLSCAPKPFVTVHLSRISLPRSYTSRHTAYGMHGITVVAAPKQSHAMAPILLRPGGTAVVIGDPADPNLMIGGPLGIVVTG